MHLSFPFRLIPIRWLTVAIGTLNVSVLAAATVSGPVTLPEGAGRAKFIELCSNCHEMSVVVALGRTRAEWGDMIATMVDRGAIVSEADFAEIQEYLTASFPPQGPVSATSAQSSE